MAQPKFICLYLSYLDSLAVLSNETRGKLLMAMLEYASSGKEPKIPKTVQPFWISMRQQIDRDMEKYQKTCEINRINAKKGGRAPRKAVASDRLRSDPKEKEKEKEKEKNNENENENEKENEREKENAIPGYGEVVTSPSPFIPPDSEEVQKYALIQGLCIDVDRFMDHYTSNGWMVGSNPMKDWKAAVRNWCRKDLHFGRTEPEYDY